MTQRPLVHRYAPFLAIVAALAMLMVVEPRGADSADPLVSAGESSLGATGGGSDVAAGGGGVSDGGTVSDGGAGGTAAGVAGGGSTGGGGGTAGADGGGVTASGQRVDGLGRPLEGDKSKCAPGGLLQENVTTLSLPCIPKFAGDNGGATYQGVTKDEILIVLFVQHYEPAVQTALQGVGLAATDQQYQEAGDVFAAFMNKHYELYGRKIKVVVVSTDCALTDSPCYRAEVKAMQAKLKPFAVTWSTPGIMPQSFADEASRQKIVNFGVGGVMTEWFLNHRPFAWTELPQAPRNVDTVADYYCKKMWGKNATLAGDPTMRVKRRKLAVVVLEVPEYVQLAQRIKQQVSGGMCGSPSDGTQIYTLSTDADQAEAQRPAFVARLKNDGITTMLQLPSGDVLGCTECDKQQYYPEWLNAGQNQGDADIVGRLDASTQRTNRFGIGFRPKATPLNDHDFRRSWHDMHPGSDPEYILEGPYLALAMPGRLIQLAGPRLNPLTLEQGAHTMVQLGGYTNPNPWPGYKCCDPAVPKWYLGGAQNYSAWWDAREIYWSDSAVSEDDGRPGAWVCVNSCKRYEVGQWPKGEPKQP